MGFHLLPLSSHVSPTAVHESAVGLAMELTWLCHGVIALQWQSYGSAMASPMEPP